MLLSSPIMPFLLFFIHCWFWKILLEPSQACFLNHHHIPPQNPGTFTDPHAFYLPMLSLSQSQHSPFMKTQVSASSCKKVSLQLVVTAPHSQAVYLVISTMNCYNKIALFLTCRVWCFDLGGRGSLQPSGFAVSVHQVGVWGDIRTKEGTISQK